MEPLDATSDGYNVALPDFEGPLDLLLHLVKRHELDIFNIPISFITEKYLEYLNIMQSLNLDVAGEFLLMAATLAHIKSNELLPRPEATEEETLEEEGPDPKEELIRRLLEYQKYKHAAEELAERPALDRQVFRRGSPQDPVDPNELPLAEVGVFALISAFADVLKRTNVSLGRQVVIDRITVSARINSIVDLLEGQATVRFEECFSLNGPAAQVRHEVVVTLLAILELAKLRMIRILQHEVLGAIYITGTEQLRTVEQSQESYS